MTGARIFRVAFLSLGVLMLAACSEAPEGLDRRGEATGATPVGQRPAEGEPGPAGASPDRAEYRVEGVLLRRDEGVLEIEEARLQRTENGGRPEVALRVSLEVPADYEDCFLLREPVWRELQRSLEDDDVPARQVYASPWGRRTLREEFEFGDEIVVIFSPSPTAYSETEDADGGKFYALCYTRVVASGGERTAWLDVTRVE